MRLKSLKLTHFSCYPSTIVIPIGDAITSIVGRSDYGQSTLCEVMAIFAERYLAKSKAVFASPASGGVMRPKRWIYGA